MFGHNVGRLLANLFIVLISLAISVGLASLPGIYNRSFGSNYVSFHAPDIILKEKTGRGFSEEDVTKVKQDKDVGKVMTLMSVDVASQNRIYRFYVMDFHGEVNQLTLKKGKYPEGMVDMKKEIPVLAEENRGNFISYDIGSKVSLKTDMFALFGVHGLSFSVTGIVDSPLYNSVQKENANLEGLTQEEIEDTYIDAVFYIDASMIPEKVDFSGMSVPSSSFLIQTDMYIVYGNKSGLFSSAYEKEMDRKRENLVSMFSSDRVVGMTLEENVSYATFKNYNSKVEAISYIFPFFFILLCALVNLITITKLIKEERGMIATYVSLGVSKTRIVIKYMLFTLISTFFGAVLGVLLGVLLLPPVVLTAYSTVFEMTSLPVLSPVSPYGYLCAFLVVAVALMVTLCSSLSYLRETPASLMKQKSPKPGKKILLQKIPFFWKPLSFRYKSSFRNIFRQKKNLILTSLSVIGTTLLIFLGFSLLDASDALKNDQLFGNVASSMGLISSVIIMFAISMGIVVIFSLANMNISDREREIATLKVLGYHEAECSMYTFREILIMSVMACLVGLPISAVTVYFVFGYLGFGSLSDVRWTSYLYTFILVISMTLILNVFLYPKIRKINMNDSLKTLE